MKKSDNHISQTDRWERRFLELVEFKKKYSHCNVPTKWPQNRKLEDWVSNQRRLFKEGKLSEDRIRRLESLGFNFDVSAATWEELYSALVEYRKINGHCNVPERRPENSELSNWVKTQRSYWKKGILSEEQVQRLEKIGFVWQRHGSAWEEMYPRLVRFKKAFGHCNVPANWKADRQLGGWVANQRHRRRKGLLKRERIKRLDEIGFEWEVDGS